MQSVHEEEDDLQVRPLSYGLKFLPEIPRVADEEDDAEEDQAHTASCEGSGYDMDEEVNHSDENGGDDGDRTINLHETPG